MKQRTQRNLLQFLGVLLLATSFAGACARPAKEAAAEEAGAEETTGGTRRAAEGSPVPSQEQADAAVAGAPVEPSTTAADAADELERAAREAREQSAAAEEARQLEEREEQVRAREAELARLELEERERRLREREREVAEREARLRAEQEREQERARAAAEAERRAADEAAEAARMQAAADSAEDVAEPEETSAPTSGDADEHAARGSEAWTGDEAWRRGNRDGAAATAESSSEERAEPAVAAKPELLRAGMRLEVEIEDTLSSGSSRVGDSFRTVLVDDVRAEDGTLVVPAGAEVHGKVVEARPLRKVGGQAALGLVLDRLVLPSGDAIEIQASLLELGRNKKGDKAKIAGAVIAGAILGSILGDSDGALVGAAAGAAASTAYVVKAEGREVEIPAGTVVTLEVEEVVTVRTQYREPR
jgi:hypothetical protein